MFINTSPPEERVQLLKPLHDINGMEDDCDEIYASSVLKRYTKRPASLEHLSLADWVALYDSCEKSFIKQSNKLDIDGLPHETNTNKSTMMMRKIKMRFINQKIKKDPKLFKVIRSVCFNKQVDSEKHYRELIMLFTSWRNETTDLLGNCSSYQQHYIKVKDRIDDQINETICDV